MCRLPISALSLMLLGWPAGALAQQALVSNIGQADFVSPSPIASALGGVDHAQQFTTGGNSRGYRLNSVEIEFARLDAGIPFSVSIRANASGAPGTVVGTLQNPAYTAFTTDTVLTFSASGSGIALAASTSYFLVLDVTGDIGTRIGNWRVTTSTNEDSGAASGWSIANLHRFRLNADGSQWTNNIVRSSLKIRINGSAVPDPAVTITRVASPVTEGATARFTVSRAGATTAALAVQLSVSENSAGGRDFVASDNEGSKTFTIPAGSASAIYSVATVGDTTDEPNGAVTVTVTAGTGYSVGTPSSATVTVNDNDLPVVTIASDTSPVTEGTAASFTVTRAGVTTAALAVSLTVADASGSDFVASGDEGAGTVTIAAGQASATYSVATVSDNTDEANGDVTVTLTAGAGYSLGTSASATVTVEDDDTPEVLIVESDGGTSVGENGGSDTYTVRLATQPSHNVTITASSATDSAAIVNKAGGSAGKTQTLTFTPSGSGAWNVLQTITVTGVNNSRDDVGNQRSSVIAHTAASSDTTYNAISIESVTVTVTDDDTPELTVAAQNGITRINESAAATIVVTSDIPVDGSIDHGQPTVSARGSVSASATAIAGGSTTNSYTVTATDNNLDEPDWSITTGISAGSGYTLGAPSSVTLAVRDDDPTIVSLSGEGSLFEGETSVFTVALGRALVAGEIIDVPLAVSGVNVTTSDWSLALQSGAGLNAGIALSGDTTATPQLRFAGAGARLATLVLTAATGSGGKTLRVELGPDGAGANGFDRTSLGSNVGGGANPHATARGSSFTVTANTVINDRDFIVFSPSRSEVSGQALAEGAQRTLTVHRIAYKPDGNGLHLPNAWGFRLCFTGTATPGADYSIRHNRGRTKLDSEGCTRTNSAADGTALTAGASLARFYITLLHDDLDETEESVIATLSRTVNSGISRDGLSETRFTIVEPSLINKVRHYTSETARGWGHVLRWRRVLYALSSGAEGEGPAMTATEAEGYADQDRTRWAPVVAALTLLEAQSRSASDEAEADAVPPACAATSASLVDTVRGYWQSNRHRADRGYGENWHRVLIAFGAETHATLTPYTAAEARAGERKWSGWRPVREELERLEACSVSISAAQDAPASAMAKDNDEPVVNPYASLIADVRGYAAETWNGPAHVKRWQRVLKALGETDAAFKDLTPMTAAEARDNAVKYLADRWSPVVAALTALEGGASQSASMQQENEPAAAPALSVSDASGAEGEAMKFTITLSPAAENTVKLLAATRQSNPVSAHENEDYQHNSWWVTFAPGETERHFWIYAFDDSHGDSGETFEVVLSRAQGATIADAVGVGTITNDDPLPGAYLARFGRAVAEQALAGIAARLEAPRELGMQGSFAGHALSFGGEYPDTDSALPAQSRSMTLREALLASSFTLTGRGGDLGGSLALWGRSAQSGFAGREENLSLDGETTTSMLGVDYQQGRYLAGLAVTRSTSEGGHRMSGAAVGEGEGDGQVEATLTAALPYASMQVADRFRVWGALGQGQGEVRLTPALGGRYQADMDWRMAAAGLRGDLMPPSDAGPALAVISDALWAHTTSEDAPGLAASDVAITGFRLGLEGRWPLSLANRASLVPRLEAGLRHDGGDAETGFGVEFGGGLSWSAPVFGLVLDVAGRSLLTHEDNGFKDEGLSFSLAFDPAPTTDRGLSFTLRQDYGSRAQGGLDALFASAPLASRSKSEAAGRWTMEAAWGMPVFGGRFTGSPYAGLGRSGLARDFYLGWRLMPEGYGAQHLSLDLQASRQESGLSRPEHTISLEASVRW